MRKIFLIALALNTGVAMAQEPADALRYSMMGHGGSARTRAIGGAVVSLGGDITAAAVNPAGLAFFRTSEFIFTPTLGLNNTRINYLSEESTKQKKTTFDVSNFGFILPKEGSVNGNWRNFTVGLGMNRRANFNNITYLNGINNQSSYSEKYLEELINKNVTNPNDAANNFPYGASLALNTYLIDTISGPNGTIAGYRSLATPQTGVIQEQRVVTRGGINDYFIAASGNFMDRLFVGGGVTFSQLKYDRTSTYKESDPTKAANNFNYFETQETLLTEGLGIGINLGVIIRPVDQIRIGASFHSPVLYNMEDLYTTTITTDVEGYQGQTVLTQSSRDFNNGEPGNFQYDFTNPMRFMFGLSYIFQEVEDVTKQRGFISADVEFLNYGKSKFNTGSLTNGINYLQEVNDAIRDQYRSAVNFRIGGELKFNTIMARLGYNYMGNAYQSSVLKGTQSSISGGLGYRDKGYFIDLTYVHRMIKDATFPYRLDNGFFAPGFVKGNNGNVVLTVGMKF